MDRTTHIARAAGFRQMHLDRHLLVLPNAWDAVTAKLYEQEGFRAIGTTSAGIASALGFPDGEVMSLEDNLSVCRRITEQVSVPVSIDIEAGYASCVKGLVDTIERVLDAGAAGINLEDRLIAGCGHAEAAGLADVAAQVERIAAVRETAARRGIPLVINARTDVILMHGETSDEWLAEVLARGDAYLGAGADCIFVPDMDILEETHIEVLVRALRGPLNLIAGSKTPSVSRLEELGVTRLSFGPRPMRVTLQLLREMAREWRSAGTYMQLTSAGSLSYDEVNAWFAGGSRPVSD